MEEADTVEVRLDDVGLRFEPDGSYYYTSTLDYEEQGTYRLDGAYLYRQPANQAEAADRPVEIIRLDSSALHLNMQADGKPRRLEFSRISESEVMEAQRATDPHDHGHDHDHDHDDHTGHDH